MAIASLYFAAGLEIGLTARTPRRAGGVSVGMTASMSLTVVRAAAGGGAGAGSHIIFAAGHLLPDGGPSEIQIGSGGLLQEDWGTVLDTDPGEEGDLQIETDDWGGVMAAGLVAETRSVRVRCRMLRSKALPRRGRIFRFDGASYVVVSVQRPTKSRAVREFTVTGLRWEDLGGMQVDPVPDSLTGWAG